MRKLSTIQKRGNLNAVYYEKVDHEDRACHEYFVKRATDAQEDGEELLRIRFQTGARSAENAVDGVTDGDILEMVRDRLRAFQDGPFACAENARALCHIAEALLWLSKRADDRYERIRAERGNEV